MTVIKANDFSKRKDIEAFIRAEYGSDFSLNAEHSISGTREELKRLHLSDTSRIFGIKCVITDTSTKDVLAAKSKLAAKKLLAAKKKKDGEKRK